MPTRKSLRPREYPREKNYDRQNTHEKKFETHEIPTRKYFGPTKYPREKFLDPRKHDGTVARDSRDPRWHKTHGL